MWQGKPVSELTPEEKNHFLTLLMGKCWHEWKYEGQCKYCGAARWHGRASYLQECAWAKNENYLSNLYGFQTVKSFMEKNLPEVWEGYLQYHIDWIDYEEIKATNTLSAWLDPTNLITFLLDNQEGWAWKECGVCKGDSCPHWGIVNVGELMSLQWYGCLTAGKIKHPALLFAEGIK